MRDYAKVSPQFWTRGSGKRLRGDADAQVLAMYLVTCPAANMVGIYYVPFVAIAHETGMSDGRASAAMGRLAEAGFAFYDADAELAWVPNMASYQIGDEIALKDNRHKGVVAEIQKVSGHPFVDRFYERYAVAYSLPARPSEGSQGQPRTPCKALPSPLQAPSLAVEGSPLQAPPKGPRPHGEEQEQEQEQEKIPLSDSRDGRPDEVWSHYVQTMKHHRPRRRPTKLRPKDRKEIRAHLAAGLTVEDLKRACEGLFRSNHHLGQNDRSTEYLEIEYALRKPATFIALADAFAPERVSGPRPVLQPEEVVDPALIDAELAKLDARFAS